MQECENHAVNVQTRQTDESWCMMSQMSCTKWLHKLIAQINCTNQLHKSIAQDG